VALGLEAALKSGCLVTRRLSATRDLTESAPVLPDSNQGEPHEYSNNVAVLNAALPIASAVKCLESTREAIAASYRQVTQRDRSAWTQNSISVRPLKEKF